MVPGIHNLVIYRGSPVDEEMTVKTSLGVAVNLTGTAPFRAQIRKGPESADLILELTVVATSLSTGVITLTATPAATAAILASGNGAWDLLDKNGQKWISGTVSISDNVTKLS